MVYFYCQKALFTGMCYSLNQMDTWSDFIGYGNIKKRINKIFFPPTKGI